jgi:hypothetical protein
VRLTRYTCCFASLLTMALCTAAVAQRRTTHLNSPIVQSTTGAAKPASPLANLVSLASWTPLAELVPPQSDGAAQFGQSVSIDGETAVVGSYGDSSGAGAAYVFVKPPSTPTRFSRAARLTASDGRPNDNFGCSVSISGDTIVVGASIYGSPGKAYVFVKPPTGWADMTETAQFSASDGQVSDAFGVSVSISGNSVVVGAPGQTVRATQDQGAAYVFVKPANGWVTTTQTAELIASDGAEYSELGSSVSISGDTVVAGARVFDRGAVYVFVEPESGWVNMRQTAQLLDSKEGIGSSVAISGTTIVTGSPSGSVGRGPSGAAVVYVRQGSVWTSTTTPTATLGASDGVPGDRFGYSVATTGDTILVGAPGAHCVGFNCRRNVGPGRVYAFAMPAGGWIDMAETQELRAHDGIPHGAFGQAVAASGSAVVAGATGTNSAYLAHYASNSGFTLLSVPGSTSTAALGINNLGQIVGGSSLGSFVDTNGVFTMIGYPGATFTWAEGINDAGEVVGYYVDSLGDSHGFTELNGVYTSMDYPGVTGTYLYGIDNAGDMVGNYCCTSTNQIQGFLYSGGVFTPITVPGAQATTVYGINNNEAITGFYCDSPCTAGSVSGGFIYSNGAFTTVNYPGAASTGLGGINDSGDFVGEWSGGTYGVGGSFVFWHQQEQFFGFNIGGVDNSTANGINNSGEIVGYFEQPANTGTNYGFYGHLPGH